MAVFSFGIFCYGRQPEKMISFIVLQGNIEERANYTYKRMKIQTERRFNMKAQDVMTRDLITIGPDTTLMEIAKTLLEHHISGLPVVDGDGRLLGIVSEGDLVYKEVMPKTPDAINIIHAIIHSKGVVENYQESAEELLKLTAADIMTRKVVTVAPTEGVNRVGRIMLEHHVKRVPVIEEDRLVGIVARADLVKLLVK